MFGRSFDYNSYMKKLFTLAIAAVFALTLVPASTYAAKPSPSSGGSSSELVGYDVSYPQCSSSLPTNQYFGIVGVNDGLATTTNPCLATQLAWANKSLTGSNQPKVQAYVNTANPGEVINQITTWPTSNVDSTGTTTANSYGTCAGQNDAACSWQYGWNRALDDVSLRFVPAAQQAGINANAGAYTWWLDVETGNTWQSNNPNMYVNNVATLEGMTSYFEGQGSKVGLYSTAAQWTQITGNVISATSNLNGLGNWRPSGTRLSVAISNCTVAPLTTGGFISLTQYVSQNLDKNHSCI